VLTVVTPLGVARVWHAAETGDEERSAAAL